jgi:hypothetical protein
MRAEFAPNLISCVVAMFLVSTGLALCSSKDPTRPEAPASNLAGAPLTTI